jgi:hypothetical protein
MRSGHYPLIFTAEYCREFLDYQELFHEKHEISMEGDLRHRREPPGFPLNR